MQTAMKATTIASLLLAPGLVACGVDTRPDDGVVGFYALDVNRTSAVDPGQASDGEASRQLDEARKARLQSKFSSEAYRVEILPNGAFRLVLQMSEEPFTISGTWRHVPEGLHLTTTAVNGEVPEEGTPTEETATVEPRALVLTQDGQTVYLRKL